jgi:hypothetical protein
MDAVNLKSNLGYVVAKRRGSVTELEEKIGRSAMKEFATIGFIKLGYYNWSKLKLADEVLHRPIWLFFKAVSDC